MIGSIIKAKVPAAGNTVEEKTLYILDSIIMPTLVPVPRAPGDLSPQQYGVLPVTRYVCYAVYDGPLKTKKELSCTPLMYVGPYTYTQCIAYIDYRYYIDPMTDFIMVSHAPAK